MECRFPDSSRGRGQKSENKFFAYLYVSDHLEAKNKKTKTKKSGNVPCFDYQTPNPFGKSHTFFKPPGVV